MVSLKKIDSDSGNHTVYVKVFTLDEISQIRRHQCDRLPSDLYDTTVMDIPLLDNKNITERRYEFKFEIFNGKIDSILCFTTRKMDEEPQAFLFHDFQLGDAISTSFPRITFNTDKWIIEYRLSENDIGQVIQKQIRNGSVYSRLDMRCNGIRLPIFENIIYLDDRKTYIDYIFAYYLETEFQEGQVIKCDDVKEYFYVDNNFSTRQYSRLGYWVQRCKSEDGYWDKNADITRYIGLMATKKEGDVQIPRGALKSYCPLSVALKSIGKSMKIMPPKLVEIDKDGDDTFKCDLLLDSLSDDFNIWFFIDMIGIQGNNEKLYSFTNIIKAAGYDGYKILIRSYHN